MIHIGDRRVQDHRAPLKYVLDHPPPVGPVNGTDENPVTDKDPPLDLLEQSPDDAEQLPPHPGVAPEESTVLGLPAGRHDDDAHEISLGGSDEADGLGGEEVAAAVVIGVEGGGGGGEVLDDVPGLEDVLIGGGPTGLLTGGERGKGGGVKGGAGAA